MSLAVLSSSGYTILNQWDRIAGKQPLTRPPPCSPRGVSFYSSNGGHEPRPEAEAERTL
jgi:hypothetical protein